MILNKPDVYLLHTIKENKNLEIMYQSLLYTLQNTFNNGQKYFSHDECEIEELIDRELTDKEISYLNDDICAEGCISLRIADHTPNSKRMNDWSFSVVVIDNEEGGEDRTQSKFWNQDTDSIITINASELSEEEAIETVKQGINNFLSIRA